MLPSSFRDPSGFLYVTRGELRRQVDESYRPHFDHLMASGLHAHLVDEGLLVPCEQIEEPAPPAPGRYRTLRPEPVPFVSYPYEWCASQLRDAALATLRIQRTALRFGMTLKDASAYNVQWLRGRPLWIDTLSFELYREGDPWIAYRQFCQHFLAPTALMTLCDPRLGGLLRVHLDGIPLDLASALLPRRTWLRPGLAAHLHVHARFQRRYEARPEALRREGRRGPWVSRHALLGLLDALERLTSGLGRTSKRSAWSVYYDGDSYVGDAFAHKRERVEAMLDAIRPASVFDLGANTGVFARMASGRGIPTVALDADSACVEAMYAEARSGGDERLLPLLLDLANPSPGLGFENREREPFAARGPADTVLALALLHHLAVANNLPLPRIAAFLASMGRNLLVEFVPKSDPKVALLLAGRADVFPDYTRQGFEKACSAHFDVLDTVPLRGSDRILYRMRTRS